MFRCTHHQLERRGLLARESEPLILRRTSCVMSAKAPLFSKTRDASQPLFSLADFEDTLPTPVNSLPGDLSQALPAASASSLVRDTETPLAALPPVKTRISAIEEFALKTHARHVKEDEDASRSKKKSKQTPKYKERVRGNQRFSPY